MTIETRTFAVDVLARVEGEGRFRLEMDGERVVSAQLSIFEAPRFFEALLRGRAIDEVADIVARICGICPIAYQMSSTSALEMAAGHVVSAPITDLRRLMYCGEWIESHALHVFMLHAPDFLGYPSVVEMRAQAARSLRPSRASRAPRHHEPARVAAAFHRTPSTLLDDSPRPRLPHRHLRLFPLPRAHARDSGCHHP